MENGEDRKALVAYKRLIEKYPKSQVPARRAPGLRRVLLQQLEGQARRSWRRRSTAYKKAAEFPESQVYALRPLQAGLVLLQPGRLPEGEGQVQDRGPLRRARRRAGGGEGRRQERQGHGLVREARNDFVRAYARERRRRPRRARRVRQGGHQAGRPLHDDEAAGEPLLRGRQGPRGGAHLQHADQGEAAVARGPRLPGQDRRLRAAHGQQGADRRARCAGW